MTPWVSTLRAALLSALLVPLTDATLGRALSIGRAFDPDRARFHAPYVITLNDAAVDQVEIITEFRRAVLFAEERIRSGDHMFGPRQAEAALQPWRGKLTITARLRFHPQNTYLGLPPFAIVLGDPPLAPADTRATPLTAYSAKKQDRGSRTALLGAVIEADFDASAVGQGRRAIIVVLEGQDAARTVVDFGKLQ